MIRILTILIMLSCQLNSDKVDELKSKSIELDSQNIIDLIPIRIYIIDSNNLENENNTILKNGFLIEYRIYTESNDTMQTIFLMNGNKDIKELDCGGSYGLLIKNIGYIGADFDSSFVLVQSFGSGNPHYIQLIEKKTGNVKLTGTWVDADENEQILLYQETESENSEALKVFDIKNEKELIITGFEDSKCVKNTFGGIRYCVEIDTVTTKYIVLKISSDEENIIKKYNR